jgi:hypothetical protein
MNESGITVADAGAKGRGLFATRFFARGDRIVSLGGTLKTTDQLNDEDMALQVGSNQWLCSQGEHPDDFANHSCEPNIGFVHADQFTHFALRDILPGEELVWDYSSSINEPEWEMPCRCGSLNCRGVIRPWSALDTADRVRLWPIAMGWLRRLSSETKPGTT